MSDTGINVPASDSIEAAVSRMMKEPEEATPEVSEESEPEEVSEEESTEGELPEEDEQEDTESTLTEESEESEESLEDEEAESEEQEPYYAVKIDGEDIEVTLDEKILVI